MRDKTAGEHKTARRLLLLYEMKSSHRSHFSPKTWARGVAEISQGTPVGMILTRSGQL